MSRGRQARFACRQCGRSTMASSYWRARCGALLRRRSCPRAAASRGAGERPAAAAGEGRQSTLGRWIRGQRAHPAPPQAVAPRPQSSGGEPRFSVSCP
eukprot:1411246-Alexandrium_andersonii.AAC.1